MLTQELIFLFSAILDAAVDRIEQGLPSGGFSVEERKFQFGEKWAGLTPYDVGAMETAGMAIATIYGGASCLLSATDPGAMKRNIGDMGIGDVLHAPVDGTCFYNVVERWIKEAVLADRIVLPDVYPFAEALAKLCMEELERDEDPKPGQTPHDTAADCIRHHEDDLVENLTRGYVADSPTRAAIARWLSENPYGCSVTRNRVDAMLAAMENQEMDNPTEDDFRKMVQKVAGY